MDKVFTNSEEEKKEFLWFMMKHIIFVFTIGINLVIIEEGLILLEQKKILTLIMRIVYLLLIFNSCYTSLKFRVYKNYQTIKIHENTLEYYRGTKLKRSFDLTSVKIKYIQKETEILKYKLHKRKLYNTDSRKKRRINLYDLNKDKFNLLIEELNRNYEIEKLNKK